MVAVGSSAGAVVTDRRLGPDQAIMVAFLSTPARDPQMAARVNPFPAPAVEPCMRCYRIRLIDAFQRRYSATSTRQARLA